jgi:hypothetical protein
MFEHDPQHHPAVRRTRVKEGRINPTAYAKMVVALMRAPQSLYDLEKVTGLHEWTLRYYVKALVLHKAAHIAGWLPDSKDRDVTPLYRLGFGVNVPRRHKTGAQKMRERRAALREQAKKLNEGHVEEQFFQS